MALSWAPFLPSVLKHSLDQGVSSWPTKSQSGTVCALRDSADPKAELSGERALLPWGSPWLPEGAKETALAPGRFQAFGGTCWLPRAAPQDPWPAGHSGMMEASNKRGHLRGHFHGHFQFFWRLYRKRDRSCLHVRKFFSPLWAIGYHGPHVPVSSYLGIQGSVKDPAGISRRAPPPKRLCQGGCPSAGGTCHPPHREAASGTPPK